MEEPLVSFIVTYYNQPSDMLNECIESILALSLSPHEREIIVVDDGADIPANTQHYDAIIHIRKPNGGVSTARNLALRLATGRYIQFVDADDMLIPTLYEHCIDMVRHSKADMVMFDFCNRREEKNDIKDQSPMTGAELMRNHNIHGSAWGYLFSRSIRKDLSFTSGIAYAEDEEFTAQLILRAESLCLTNAKAYLYRQHGDSITQKGDKRSIIKRFMDTKTVISRLNTLADRMPINERTALQRRVAQLTMDYLYQIIRLTNDRTYLLHKIDSLRREGLFPLPDKDYTTKYTWFRRLTNSRKGLSILMRVIPLIHKER